MGGPDGPKPAHLFLSAHGPANQGPRLDPFRFMLIGSVRSTGIRCGTATNWYTVQIHHVINDITGLTSLAIVDAILQFAEKLEAIIGLYLNPPVTITVNWAASTGS